MRAKLLVLLLLALVAWAVTPLVTHADTPSPIRPVSANFVNYTPIPIAPPSTYQTALKAGDTASFQIIVNDPFGLPTVIADLSGIGFSSSSTFPVVSGPYPNSDYSFQISPPLTIGADVSDGVKSLPLTITDAAGNTNTFTTHVIVDNAPPTIALTNSTFSTTSPKEGDYLYLTGVASGTGSALTITRIETTLLDANRNLRAPWPYHVVSYPTQALTNTIASSTDGSFTNFSIQLYEAGIAGDIQASSYIQLTIGAYDEAGNIVSTVYVAPIPHPAPPPTICTPSATCVSNVLFLPGIEGSRLYLTRPDGSGDQLWEPNADSDVQGLFMNADGTSARSDIYTKERGVIDELPDGENIYKSFIAKMDGLKTAGTINDWEPVAYDWRLSLDDILNYGNDVNGRIYYSGDLRATSTPYVIQELRRLAASSKTGKVTIVAHSNGGLVTKRLTQLLGPEASQLIDKIIFVAVPQAGTPAAVAGGLHGYDQDHAGGFAETMSTGRTLAQNAPAEYNLLPSAQYFTQVDNPVASFDYSLPDWISRYGSVIHSQSSLHQFLTDSYGRVDPQTGDIDQPIQLNNALLTSAEALHASLDAWVPPAGVSLVQIAGWGVPKTVAGVHYSNLGIQYSNNSNAVRPDPDFTIDGDGTVVVPSALWTSTTTGAQNYWVDLEKYNKTFNKIAHGTLISFDHGSILELDGLEQFISDVVTGIVKPLEQYSYLSTTAPHSNDPRLRYALHSPLTLNLYDSQGRHTGVSTTTGRVEEQIPGTYYTEFGDVKYLFTDASTTARVVMNGYAPGTFTLNVDQYSGNTPIASTTFKDVPTTPSTTVTLGVQSDISTLSNMNVDANSDGITDFTLAPKLGGTVTLDTTPPELRFAFSTSTIALTISATDDSGAASLVSTTTYPALKKNQKNYQGTATTTVTARDGAGNSTKLIYTELLPSPAQRDTITPLALVYNGATTTLANSLISYKWRVATSTYSLFAANLHNATTTLESHWRPKKAKTIIMLKPQDLDDTDTDDAVDVRPTKITLPGMVIPYIVTQKGSIVIGY